MSLEENSLRNEMASYLRGEQPIAEMLAVAPTLHRWAVKIARGQTEYEMTLIGQPMGHSHLVEGREMTTSPIVWLDCKWRWARAQDRLWQLGEPEG